MATAAEAAALVEPSAATKKRAPAEIEENEGEAQHLKKHMRWQGRVAALQRVPRMASVAAAAATAVGREAGVVDACAGQGSVFYSHSAAQSNAPSPATALTALPITAGRTATPSQAPSFLTSDDRRCLANEEVHRVGTLPVHSPSFGAMPGGGPRGKKRKSPRLSMGIFRSPLSRMMLSPISRTSFTPSPRATHVTSHRARCTIDLNAEPEDVNTEMEELNVEMEEANTELEELNAEMEEANTKLEEPNAEMEEENDVIGGAPPTQAFQDYSPWKADRIFLTLHGCLKEVMKIDGGNAYDVPHIRKEMLEREGRLPVQLDCEPALVQKAMDKLNE
ncbi:hypothetical protein EJB05_39998 [Eragrostis curvula]|uniref:Uncharacterized protein n=1 Tax=Eragrostis curvula TaxID=38414 RepID=A0A5J9TYT9_9POAL|nr:hypothetical protein EJB05_39998 [Eragrostis curvula]